MSYLPWPQEGCSLKAARQRTADRMLWRRWLDESASASHGEIEDKIFISFQEIMARGELVAYGGRSTDQSLELIDRALWMQHLEIDWKTSTVGERGLKALAFQDVIVFPRLLSPDNAKLLDGRSLSEAFKELVLGDPEVAAMGRRAIELSPDYARVFRDGRRTKYGVVEWPVACDRWVLTGAVHPDPEKQSAFDGPDADPLEVFMAAEALEHRYRRLMELLGIGELEAVGVSANSGSIEMLPRSIWSHEDFWIDVDGNVLQETEQTSRAQRRWVGVLLRRTHAPEADLVQRAMVSHRLPSTAAVASNNPADRHEPLISRADALAAGDLATALRVLILSHPIVERLRAKALATGVCARSLEEDAGLVIHFPGFDTPILRFFEIEAKRHTRTTDFDPAEEFYPMPDRAPECQAYCDALRSRANAFFGLLQRGEVVGFGHVAGGALIEISRAIWCNGDYCANPRTGDIFEMGPAQHVRVWSAVTLKPGEMFHVGPTTFDQPPSTTTASDNRSPQATSSRIVTTNIAIRECTAWIEQIIRASPNQRTESRASLWQEAQHRWPKTLSERSFLGARAEAIKRTENAVWNTGGAPRKNRRGKTEASE